MRLSVRSGAYYLTDYTAGVRVRGYVHTLYARYCGRVIAPVTEKQLAWRLGLEIYEAVHNTAHKRYKSSVEAIREYLEFRHDSGVSSAHIANLAASLRKFTATCAIDSVNEITEAVAARYIESLQIHAHTKNKVLSAIQGFCKYAKKHGWLATVPTRDIGRYPERDPRVGRVISEEELALLEKSSDQFFAAVIRFAAATGLRRGEIMHLWRTGWVGLDLSKGEYTLPAAATKSRRDVTNPLSPDAVDAAKTMMKLAPRTVWSRDAFTQKFIRLCRDVGIKARFHDLRHTFNARLGMLQLSPGTRARLMNQSTPDLSESRYHHDSIEYLHKIMDKLG